MCDLWSVYFISSQRRQTSCALGTGVQTGPLPSALYVRTQLSLDKPDHRAEATVNIAGRTLHADASAIDMYAAIDLLADKLDRLLVKHKEKQVDTHRRAESSSRSGDFA